MPIILFFVKMSILNKKPGIYGRQDFLISFISGFPVLTQSLSM